MACQMRQGGDMELKNLDWIRSLVEAEQQMEETGMIDLSAVPDETRDLEQKTNEFLKDLKESFIDYVTAFNNLKNSTIGSVKVYGISNTVADFMLFRNGYKLIFSAEGPGQILMAFQSHSAQFMPMTTPNPESPTLEERLDAKYGPFGEMTWTYRGTEVQAEYLVRYYLSRFIKESAK